MPEIEGIYRTHLDFVYRICFRYCKDHAEAEDLTQEIFLKIDRKLASFRGESELSTWIYRLSTNSCLDHLRKLRRQDKLKEEFLDGLVIRNLSESGDRELARIDLERILGAFRPIVRQMLFLTLAEGLSYRQAGEVLNVSKDAVSKTVARFIQKFSRRPRAASDLSEKKSYLSMKPASASSKGDMAPLPAPEKEGDIHD